jgi:hypothetical protein
MRIQGRTARLAALAVAMIGLALLPGAALATHSSGKGPKHDLVAGTGKSEGFQVHVNAKQGKDGAGAGHVFFHSDFAELNFKGRVTCLDATGSDAVVSGVIERFAPEAGMPPGSGGTFNVYIHDGGEGSDAADTWFANLVFGDGSPAPTTCGLVTPFIPVERGNFSVHDGS